MEENKKEDININVTKSKKKKAKVKKKINKQLLAVILIIIACVAITVALIVLKIRNINKAYAPKQENNVFVSEEKQEDDELKYVLTENDTLDFNDIEIIDKWIVNGEEIDHNEYNYDTKYSYIKISGLKNKDVENKINEDIKSSISKLGESCNGKFEVSIVKRPDICGNFSNILSFPVCVYNEHYQDTKNLGLNYNLKTGEKFTFEDIFIKSAPIVSMLYNGVIKSLAWDRPDYSNFNTDEEYFNFMREWHDMEKRDTSEYEDVVLKVAKWYKENKGNIKFSVSDNRITVYDVKLDGYDKAYNINIDSYIYKDYIAIYKRFAGGDLYENDINGGGYIPFAERMVYGNERKEAQLVYGKKSDNLFVDIAYTLYNWTLEDKNIEKKIRDFSQIIANNFVVDITKEANSNLQNGYVLQGFAHMNSSLDDNYNYYYDNDNNIIYTIPHYSLEITLHKSIITKDDFKDLNKYLAICAVFPNGGSVPLTINYTLRNLLLNKPEEDSSGSELKRYYFDINGNYLGDNKECIRDTTRNTVYNPS